MFVKEFSNWFYMPCFLVLYTSTYVDFMHCKVAAKAVSSCPQESEKLHRLGKSRFYVYDIVKVNITTFDYDGITWTQGHSQCTKLGKLRMAVNLNKITTNGLIARGLERKAAEMNFKQTILVTFGIGNFVPFSLDWINARYDASKTRYYWGANKNDFVRYGNFYYKQPRPIGVGAHYGSEYALNPWNSTEKYNKKSNKEQCLAFALSFMNRKELGFQASWLERACKDRSYRRVLCESTNPACEENKSKNPHVLTEDKEYYFTEGNWIFANRRFIVNWAPRKYDEAKEYCKKLNLDLFHPLPEDECLIPYLKLWAPVLSTYNFWTGYNYFEDKQEFRDEKGQVFQKGASLKHDYTTRTSKTSNKFCVAYQWTYEFKNETRCGNEKNPEAGCDWMYYILAPSNCNNFIGTVCQHASIDNTRICDYRREWINDTEAAIKNTAVVPFGYRGSGFWRSTYKQMFGSRICGSGNSRQMIDYKVEYWKVDPASVEFTYDYEETYWIVDEQLFENVGKDEELCTVSHVTSTPDPNDRSKLVYSRELKKVNCNEWHFYLCESV